MRALTAKSLTSFAAAAAMVIAAGTAEAACKKMGFLVNDYGKDGPSKDAQDLLDKHVAEWAAQNNIKNYTIGKKDVKCELYIDVILFDEHTCTASANVCWDEPGKEAPAKTAKDKAAADKTKAAEKKSSEKPAAPVVEKTAEKAPEAIPAAAIETGTLPTDTDKPAPAAAADDDAAERAAAAAERAAEAAERAAAAAEKAAAAANPTTPSQLEMPSYGAGKPAEIAPVTPVEPKS